MQKTLQPFKFLLYMSGLLFTLFAALAFSPLVSAAPAASFSAHNLSSTTVQTTSECGGAGCVHLTLKNLGNGNVQATASVGSFCILEATLNVAYDHNQHTQNNSTGQPCTSSYSHTFPPVHLGPGRHQVNVTGIFLGPEINESDQTEDYINL